MSQTTTSRSPSFTLERTPSERLITRSSLFELSVSTHSSPSIINKKNNDSSTTPLRPELRRTKSCVLRMRDPVGSRRGSLTFTHSTRSLKRAGSSRKIMSTSDEDDDDTPPKSPVRRNESWPSYPQCTIPTDDASSVLVLPAQKEIGV
jgi:hypothetical protein